MKKDNTNAVAILLEILEKVTLLFEKQNSQYADIMLSIKKLEEDKISDDRSFDELYEEAKNIVIKKKKASASLLQKTLGIGYSRACTIIDALEEREVIGFANNGKPRTVLQKK